MRTRNNIPIVLILIVSSFFIHACSNNSSNKSTAEEMTARDILGNPNYPAICYGGYRANTREIQPTIEELKEDMKILYALGKRIVRTYHTERPHASNVVKAIHELKQEDPDFEMYVMLGAWIDCKGAWTENPNHNAEDSITNQAEVDKAVRIAQEYPDIVKIIAVGNEAMVHWAATYYVQPRVILKYVNQLQELKKKGELPSSMWITSSDNFASWGGGSEDYHKPGLEKLLKAVDYVSLHTYPMHDTHYNPAFWGLEAGEDTLNKKSQIELAMMRAVEYAKSQYTKSKEYIHSVVPGKVIHIGETGWASYSNGHYGDEGSNACDEYKEGIYYKMIHDFTEKENISCFYFEGFDEIWKDAENPGGSENHFGLFTIDGKAKFAVWDMVDNGALEGLSRGGKPVVKTLDGDFDALLDASPIPAMKEDKKQDEEE